QVLEILVAGLEGRQDGLDRDRVADDVLSRDEGKRVADVAGEVVADADLVGMAASFGVAAEHEQRQGGGVAADRRVGLRGACLQRPAGGLLRARPVAREDERLDRADRPAPAAGRRIGEALAVTGGGAAEPRGCPLAVPLHQEREPGATGRVAEPRQLPLARVRLVLGRPGSEPRLAVPVATLLAG